MQRYKIVSLVDITRSMASRSETDKIKIGQQSNFNSLLQAIGLRANIEWKIDPKMFNGRLPEGLDGSASHWIWEFDVERQDVFLKSQDAVGLLVDDLHGVPVVSQLNNSTNIDPACFITIGKNQNTWAYKLE